MTATRVEPEGDPRIWTEALLPDVRANIRPVNQRLAHSPESMLT
jgi:hypothetical protein